jgi:hypothetical protein
LEEQEIGNDTYTGNLPWVLSHSKTKNKSMVSSENYGCVCLSFIKHDFLLKIKWFLDNLKLFPVSLLLLLL